MTKKQEHVADLAQCWPSARERERDDSERDLPILLHRFRLYLFDVRRGFSARRIATVRHLR